MKDILITANIVEAISKAGNSYKYLSILIPVPGSEPVEKRIYELSATEIALLEIYANSQ